MMRSRTTLFFLTVVLVPWMLVSCYTPPWHRGVKAFNPGQKVSRGEGEALIFGRLLLNVNEEQEVPYSSLRWSQPILTISQLEAKKLGRFAIEGDGDFYWIVSPGNYIIPFMIYQRFCIHPQISFQVPSEGKAFYLGELTIDAELKTPLFKLPIEKIRRIEILDDFEKAKDRLTSRNPDLMSHNVEKSLMTMIPGKSATVSSEEEYCGGFPGDMPRIMIFP